jgi:signal peptidase II
VSEPSAPSAPSVRRPVRQIAIGAIAALGLLALDLGTKEWTLHALSMPRRGQVTEACEPGPDGRIPLQRLRTEQIEIIPGYFGLRYAENCGAAFGLLHDAPRLIRRSVFGIAAVIASGVLAWMFVIGRGGRPFAWAVPMIVSGAIGNLVDRVRHGYVVDFIRLHLENGPEWPTFNIADAGITVGVVLLLVDGMRKEVRAKTPEPAPAAQPEE